MSSKLLSIIIPVYNVEKYISRCLDSVLSQTYRDIEVIVVNDASPGNILEIYNDYSSDKRLKLVSYEKNKGLFHARLEGAKVATGEYIAFLDGDDYVTVDHYRTLMFDAEKNCSDIVVGNTIHQRKDGTKFIYNLHEQSLDFEILEKKDIKDRYFEQRGLCYSWHTIWNKIYSKNLWDKAMGYYEKVSGHIIMTEDIAFSTVLFYLARRVTRVKSGGVYYCENEGASTDSNEISFPKYSKNVEDLKKVFSFVESFLEESQAEDRYKNLFHEFKKYYSRMWRELGEASFRGLQHRQVEKMMDEFCPNYKSYTTQDDHFFSSVETVWNDGIENIKEQIISERNKVISFDIFDTLVYRNLYRPEDLFLLLDKERGKEHTGDFFFPEMRIQSEKEARKNLNQKFPQFEDVTLDEIYSEMGRMFHLSEEAVTLLKNKEISMEIEMCYPRRAAMELFQLAKYIGKTVVITSDMYLREESIIEILEKNGYSGYARLFLSSSARQTKYNASLFKHMLSELKVSPNEVLHIGDNWQVDIEKSSTLGMNNCFFPKAIEVLENKIKGVQTNSCGYLGYNLINRLFDTESIRDSFSYRTMLAMVANQYFDNPYRSFNEYSDLNADAYLVGYYPLAMHMISLTDWIRNTTLNSNYSSINFLARDGYLPYRSLQKMEKYRKDSMDSNYIYISRKMVLPYICENKTDLFNLPIEKYNHTPRTVLELLHFCSKAFDEDFLKEHGFLANVPFYNEEQFRGFIGFFIDHLYDEERHKTEKDRIKAYYQSKLQEGSLCFDMGYSGRIQSALCKAVERSVDALFVYSDKKNSIKNSRKNNYRIFNLYPFVAKTSGAIREHIFSSTEGSAIGVDEQGNEILENRKKDFQEVFIVNMMQKGALDFIDRFYTLFHRYIELFDIRDNLFLSMPFESFLNESKDMDIKIFASTYFEDTVYGAKDRINLYEFIKTNRNKEGDFSGEVYYDFHGLMDNMTKNRMLLLRVITLLIYDRKLLKDKVKGKLKNHPKIFILMKKSYNSLKKF